MQIEPVVQTLDAPPQAIVVSLGTISSLGCLNANRLFPDLVLKRSIVSWPHANVVAEAYWLHNLLFELRYPLTMVTLVYCDDVNAIYYSKCWTWHRFLPWQKCFRANLGFYMSLHCINLLMFTWKKFRDNFFWEFCTSSLSAHPLLVMFACVLNNEK